MRRLDYRNAGMIKFLDLKQDKSFDSRIFLLCPEEYRVLIIYFGDHVTKEDAGKPIRKSHENPDIIAIYKEYYGEPCGHLSHEQLHTHYFDKSQHVEACGE